MSTVYVVQEVLKRDRETGEKFPVHNVRPAAVYGDLVPLLGTKKLSLLSPGPTVHELRSKLRDYTEDDFILPVGDPVAIAIATSIAAEFSGGRVNMLKWDRDSRSYIKIAFDLSGRT